jgi:hypothetical protein
MHLKAPHIYHLPGQNGAKAQASFRRVLIKQSESQLMFCIHQNLFLYHFVIEIMMILIPNVAIPIFQIALGHYLACRIRLVMHCGKSVPGGGCAHGEVMEDEFMQRRNAACENNPFHGPALGCGPHHIHGSCI